MTEQAEGAEVEARWTCDDYAWARAFPSGACVGRADRIGNPIGASCANCPARAAAAAAGGGGEA